jgi:hypothetical protein
MDYVFASSRACPLPGGVFRLFRRFGPSLHGRGVHREEIGLRPLISLERQAVRGVK